MILRSLSLSNFHRFEHFKISFDDHLTVLVGDNGSGKSSILRAASIALGTFLSGFDGASSMSISPLDARLVTYERDGAIDRRAQYPVDIEAVGEKRGVLYIDDSKGTNVDATLTAVGCMQSDTVILLGGKDKGYDYGGLFEKLKGSRVVHAVLYGENRFKLLAGAAKAGYEQITLCAGFEMAVRIASMTAARGQCVLLSPASSSYDMFSGYEERGERFCELVAAMEEGDACGADGGE